MQPDLQTPLLPAGDLSVEDVAARERSLGAAYAEVAAEHADRLAVASDKQELSYAELDAMSNRVASSVLEQLGDAEEPVAVLCDPGASLISGLLGVLKAGKIVTPLDPEMPVSALRAIVEAAGARLVVGSGEDGTRLAGEIAQGAARAAALDQLETGSSDPPTITVEPGAGALLFFTSGSTGEPKGVVQPHRMQLHHSLATARQLGLQPGERVAQLLTPSFAGAYVSVLPALLTGASLLRFDLRGQGFAPLPSWLSTNQVVMTGIVPTMLRPLALAARERPIEHLRWLVMMGERVSPEHVTAARAIVGSGGTVINLYGASEAQVIATHLISADEPFDDTDVPLGRPHPGGRLRLVADVDPPPEDGLGEIEVAGRYLAHGYWRDREASARVFAPTGEPGEWSYRTGDLGRIEAGRLYHAGRGDRRVKVRGHPVEIDAVERALRELEGVREAAVVDRSEPHGGSALDAYVVVADRDVVTPQSLRAELRAQVAEYMVPRRVEVLEALPLLSSGKLDRQSLIDRQPAASTVAGASEIAGAERALANLWHEILGTAAVGVDDDFFELGGDSLKGAELMIAIEERLGQRLPVSTLVHTRTVAGLAAMLRGPDDGETTVPVAVSEHSGARPALFFCPGLLGSAFELRELGAALPADQPLRGFDSPVWAGDGSSWTVEAIAHRHVEEMTAAQAAGPYRLGGYSFGGLVALEMARELERVGEQVSLLALLGTRLPPFSHSVPQFPGPAVLRPPPGASLRQRAAFHRQHLRRAGPRQAAGDLVRRVGASGPADRAVWKYDLARRGRVRARWRASYVWATSVSAAERYRPASYGGQMTLLRPRDYDEVEMSRWDRVARGGLQVHRVAASHEELLQQPAVADTARLLGELMETTTASAA